MQETNLIYTRSAHCRDCYKCLRNCPVTCISMNEGQAQVINEKCIVCGTCLRNCPQDAKQYISSVYNTENLLTSSGKKVISVAPSFVANYDKWQYQRLPSALRLLGFDYVYETAIGAFFAARESLKYIKDKDKSYIHSSCPAVINYITKYKSELVNRLAPVVSPMIAHSRLIKENHGQDTKIVFLGPCVAKKDEATWESYQGSVLEVLTFREIEQMFKNKGIDLKTCDESSFDSLSFDKAKEYPLPGGILKVLDIAEKDLEKKVLCFNGFSNVKNALDHFGLQKVNYDIELMWCDGGCLNGPISIEDDVIKKYFNVLEYATSGSTLEFNLEKYDKLDLSTKFQKFLIPSPSYTEEQVEEMLKTMGKEKEQDRLNCQGCGYLSCYDKAIAILNGYAQKEMCMPYLRKHLFSQSLGIIDNMPSGVVVLDAHLNIIQTNSKFNKMFKCDGSVVGGHISVLMDSHPFERVLSGDVHEINWIHEFVTYKLKCRFIVYDIKNHEQLVGIFIPILSDEELAKVRSSMKMQALDKAKELLKHQIETGQKVAKYLGESIAESQDIVYKIVQITSEEESEDR